VDLSGAQTEPGDWMKLDASDKSSSASMQLYRPFCAMDMLLLLSVREGGEKRRGLLLLLMLLLALDGCGGLSGV